LIRQYPDTDVPAAEVEAVLRRFTAILQSALVAARAVPFNAAAEC
jgi:hypothetical protein